MTSFKRTQREYVQKAYRVRNWREYETGLRARGSLTVWLGLTDGKLANWNSPRPTRRKPGRQRKYSNHAIETTVTLGLVFGLASRQTEGFLRSLLTLRESGVYPGFPTLFWGLSGFFVNDLMGKALWSSWRETRSVFQGAVR